VTASSTPVCGTGKYWPILLAAGLTLLGTDQSQAMLDVATAKHPHVTTRLLAVQDGRRRRAAGAGGSVARRHGCATADSVSTRWSRQTDTPIS
jgi:hypothetical protein